jgi:hypothetical protein
MPLKKSDAEAWLLAGSPVSGALAWHEAPRSEGEATTSQGARAWAMALVAKDLPTPRLSRVRTVETLLAELEQAESQTQPRIGPRRKHG